MGFLNADGLKYAWQTYIAKALEKKVDKISGKGLSTNDYTTNEKNKLDGIAAGAEVNQNAFSNIKVGDVTIAADNKTDTFTLVAGDNVTITPTEGSDSIEIKTKDTVYTHPTTSGNKHIPAGGSVGQVLKNSADGIAVWSNEISYSAGTGISVSSDNKITNTGVRSIGTGSANGTISVNTNGTAADIAIKGLGSAAYTNSSVYATSAQGTKADNAMPNSGGTFGGHITLYGDPTANLHPVTKQYFDSELLELSDKIDNITHPITSVNGKTGVVKLTAADVGALPNTTSIPSIEGLATETFVTNITNNKVDKVSGKGLSTNDYTTAEKNKLAGIAEGANKTVVDTTLSTSSANPVQNKVIKDALDSKSDSDHTHTAAAVGADAAGSANTALTNAKKYTDDKIALIMNNSSEAVDSIMELATAMEDNADVVKVLEEAIGKKADSDHTHNYAGSSSVGGAATSANKLNTNAGSATQPVYFANGIPVKTTYTLGASVPSDAKFTDTVYTHPAYTARTAGLYKITVDSTGHVSAVSAVAKSDITALGIPAQDTTYGNATSSAAGLMSPADKKKLDYVTVTYDSTSNTVTFS